MRGFVIGFLLVGCLIASDGIAQQTAPTIESITVNGRQVPDQEIRAFVESRATPTFRLHKVARWEEGICPVAVGLKPAFLNFITRRVRENATNIGAPVNNSPDCKANIEIVFTTQPQLLLDNVRKDHRYYLGFHYSSSQADQLARVTHAIQAWYATQTIDEQGVPHFDTPQTDGVCGEILKSGNLFAPDCKNVYYTNGMRLANELRSGLAHVIIAIDPNKLTNYEVGALADYISFLALAQPRSLDACEDLPTILNMLAPNCDSAASIHEMTNGDIGYLRGLYHMTADGNLTRQQNEIAYQVKQTLLGH